MVNIYTFLPHLYDPHYESLFKIGVSNFLKSYGSTKLKMKMVIAEIIPFHVSYTRVKLFYHAFSKQNSSLKEKRMRGVQLGTALCWSSLSISIIQNTFRERSNTAVYLQNITAYVTEGK